MPTLEVSNSQLLIIDMQSRLVPALSGAENLIKNTGILLEAAVKLNVPLVYTEQNPEGIGETLPELRRDEATLFNKTNFDALQTEQIANHFRGRQRDIIVTGCEAHICVLQTVLGLKEKGHNVYVVLDAIGSRKEASKKAAVDRMKKHGAEMVTTEMVLFEWLKNSDHPDFRELVKLIK